MIKINYIFVFLFCLLSNIAFASTEDLAKATQNPISDLVSLPFQNNTNFGFGPNDKIQNVLNIQPVAPFAINSNLNLITRTIVPVLSQPSIISGDNRKFGLGDTIFTTFFSPAKSGQFIWGVGTVFLFPTSTSSDLGTKKWGIGPSLVGLKITGNWVYGALINNIWSYAGDKDKSDVNSMTLQPFINYNFPKGVYLTTSPIITANWKVNNKNRWVIPLGGGIGKIFKIGKQPMNAQIHGYYNIEKPKNAGDWTLRLQLQFLFPKI